MDLRRSVHLVRRHRFLVGGVVTLGLVLGGGYAVLRPPMITSTAEVLLSQSSQAAQAGAAAAASGSQDPYTATQLVIAKSTPVLVGALPDARPIMSVSQLSRDVQAGSLTPYVISIRPRPRPTLRRPLTLSLTVIFAISVPAAVRAGQSRPSCLSRPPLPQAPD
jgi:hypothetical protein